MPKSSLQVRDVQRHGWPTAGLGPLSLRRVSPTVDAQVLSVLRSEEIADDTVVDDVEQIDEEDLEVPTRIQVSPNSKQNDNLTPYSNHHLANANLGRSPSIRLPEVSAAPPAAPDTQPHLVQTSEHPVVVAKTRLAVLSRLRKRIRPTWLLAALVVVGLLGLGLALPPSASPATSSVAVQPARQRRNVNQTPVLIPAQTLSKPVAELDALLQMAIRSYADNRPNDACEDLEEYTISAPNQATMKAMEILNCSEQKQKERH